MVFQAIISILKLFLEMAKVELMKLMAIENITGRIVLKSGLHIGAGDTEMHIGGTDNPIIKHPHTLEPYIPGSSLKGKVRSLLELRSGLMAVSKGEPLQIKHLRKAEGQQREQGARIVKLFGCSGAEGEAMAAYGPTRVAFADCPLHPDWREFAAGKRLSLVEVKSENSINRIQGTALNPRFTERVPATAEFTFAVSLKRFEDDGEDLLDTLLAGLKLLELDALGGSGSRGYGRVRLVFDREDLRERFEKIDPFA